MSTSVLYFLSHWLIFHSWINITMLLLLNCYSFLYILWYLIGWVLPPYPSQNSFDFVGWLHFYLNFSYQFVKLQEISFDFLIELFWIYRLILGELTLFWYYWFPAINMVYIFHLFWSSMYFKNKYYTFITKVNKNNSYQNTKRIKERKMEQNI